MPRQQKKTRRKAKKKTRRGVNRVTEFLSTSEAGGHFQIHLPEAWVQRRSHPNQR